MIWYERWQVRRAAHRRRHERRSLGVVDWSALATRHGQATGGLTKALERAVLAADEVSAYETRLFGGREGESPFRLRRRRVEAALGRFNVAIGKVSSAAAQWIDEASSASTAQQRFAIEQLVERLAEDRVPEFSDIDPTIGALEAALTNLYRAAECSATVDPFRTLGHRT